MPRKKAGKKPPKSSQKSEQPSNQTAHSNASRPPPELEMDLLAVGMNVEIGRSDGRVHAAVIAQLKPADKMVDVEWFEGGETKGKSIDLASLFRHNPKIAGLLGGAEDIRPSKDAKNKRKTLSIAQATVEAREKNGAARHREMETLAEESPQQPPAAKKTGREQLTVGQNPDGKTVEVEWFENGETKGKTVDISTLLPDHTLDTTVVTEPAPPSGDRQEDEPPDGLRVQLGRPNAYGPSTKKAQPPVIPQQQAAVQSPVREESPEPPSPPRPPAPARRSEMLAPVAKHAVVVRTEEIERQRVDRRAHLAAEKQKRDELQNLDPGNPHWPFLKMIREYRATLEFRPLKLTDEVLDNQLCVCVRKRPLSRKELTHKDIDVVTIASKDHVIVHQTQAKVDLTKPVDNEMVYRFTAQPLVKTIFEGGFATCFAYGQTGSGKTHTMGGDFEGKAQDCSKGIYALAASDVFECLNEHPEFEDEELYVTCSFFELYGSKAFDLLAKRASLRILEDNKRNVQIVGLKEQMVNNAQEVLKLIREGSALRTAGTTSANANSSRSHAVFQIILKRYKDDQVHGKFSLIDLAGNERGADTTASNKQTCREGGEINKSLLALKECLRAMGKNQEHVPFRGSKLTLVLRDSFIGRNAKTCMIATISPGLSSTENTLNTLRYAKRAKELALEDVDQA
ncbi:Kinesin-like protein [Aphelenchoides fujianensis]|nr:Kinesin-like protein [Aphelenchoides fujianensis]